MTYQRPQIPKKGSYKAFDNFLMTKYERLVRVVKPRSYPYVMTIDPSSICQLRCRGCMTGLDNEFRKRRQGSRVKGPLARLKHDVVESILDEFGDVMFYCNFFNWGEPLLHENLPDYVAAASERGIYTALDSNLSLRCEDSFLEDLLVAGLDEFGASIDGFSQETYEKYRVGGQFDLVVSNLKRLVAIRQAHKLDTNIVWRFLIFSHNEHEVEAAGAFCRDLGIVFQPRDAVFMKHYADWTPSYRREGKPNPHQLDRRAQLQSSDYMTPVGLIPMAPGKPAHRSCGWHYAYSTVNADGAVLPCCGLYDRKHNFGTVTGARGSFGELWRNGEFEAVRREFPDRQETRHDGPTTCCTQCNRADTFLDHYQIRDREIVRKFWASLDDPEVRRLETYFRLLQKSPPQFTEAFADHYERGS
jgi:MoaA/NifB/PqqE/SkfB family radical SAM enzyme